MIIWLEEPQAGTRWVVHLDALCIGFRSVDEARAFTRTLQARIDAPHVWPRSVIERTGAAHVAPAASPRTSAPIPS
ncbi:MULTISPECIES: hypothetical protein [Pseudomonas]|jgi:hypothetical protein|uniref:Uncharacterized protein n=1 Tax=Pseudomonas synxantha TaxID=47883 RepID=A0A5D3GGR0_9PSED|nr:MULTISPECIES: hypothetical protein [Pseudomonas]MCK3828555.1 hypothetical protein [Pseudomonas sp. W2Aug9]OPB07104.1 hypothetical protein BFW89_08470 [Pseudomonas synxantha]TYK59643.1 hypothetical protein FXO26_00590 [Pseudomonas synxantha]